MGVYAKFVMPRVINWACGINTVKRQRQKVVPRAKGVVLEIGFGSGLNLPHYDDSTVTKVYALEPASEMLGLAQSSLAATSLNVELLRESAESISLDDDTVDTVLVTYTLCTVPDPGTVLAEIRRVLRPGGTLIFCEHGASPDRHVRRWQDRLNPLWRRMGGGCNLNRAIPDLLHAADFEIPDLETMHIPGWRPATFNFWGSARLR